MEIRLFVGQTSGRFVVQRARLWADEAVEDGVSQQYEMPLLLFAAPTSI